MSTFTDGFTKVLLISDTDESSHNHSSNSLLKTAVKDNSDNNQQSLLMYEIYVRRFCYHVIRDIVETVLSLGSKWKQGAVGSLPVRHISEADRNREGSEVRV